MKKNIVKYKENKEGIVRVVSINGARVEEVNYFDMEDFTSNIGEIVYLITGSYEFSLKKCIF